jgi:hypothetical protein
MLRSLLVGYKFARTARSFGVYPFHLSYWMLCMPLHTSGMRPILHCDVLLVHCSDGPSSEPEHGRTGELASEDWWGRQGTYIPPMPPSAELQDVLRDLFQAPALPSSFGRSFPSPDKGKQTSNMLML